MTVYALAQLSFVDRRAYDRYAARFLPTLKPFGGELLAADEAPETIEGRWSGDKVVLIRFADSASLRAWIDSPDYRKIAVDRRAGAEGPVLLIHGLERPALRTGPEVEREW